MEDFQGVPWLPRCLMAMPPSVVSEGARAWSCAAEVFPDPICQKGKNALSVEEQLVVGSKLVALEKWLIGWKSCGEGWLDGTDLPRYLWNKTQFVSRCYCKSDYGKGGWLPSASVQWKLDFSLLSVSVSDYTRHKE